MKLSAIVVFIVIGIYTCQAQNNNTRLILLYGPVHHVFNKNTNKETLERNYNHSVGLLVAKDLNEGKCRIRLISGYYIDTKRYSFEINDPDHPELTQDQLKFVYGNVPVRFETTLSSEKRWQPSVYLGIDLGFLLKSERYSVSGSTVVSNGFGYKVENKTNMRFLTFGSGINYMIDHRWNAQITCGLKYWLSKREFYNIWDNKSDISFSVVLNMSYNFYTLWPKRKKNE